ncbi:MAG: 4-alpha-glucanotransferase [Chitinophagaceae bacterium]|nr:4-alpha-glucanotransferase [Chitinophagaceae bacterium]
MKIHFYIRYYTRPGESLHVTGNIEELGDGDYKNAFALEWLDSQYWHGVLQVDPTHVTKIRYKYIFKNVNGEMLPDGCRDRVIDISKTGIEEIQLTDTWNHSGEFENVFYTDPFRKVLLRDHHGKVKAKSPKKFTHIFRVKAPLLKKNETIFLLGNAEATGNWNLDAPLLLAQENEWWTIKLNMPKEAFPLFYKYGVYNTDQKKVVEYEAGENRLLQNEPSLKKLSIVHDGFVRIPNNTWKGAGVSIPVFSLRSKDSFGVGEFCDLKLLADWAKKTKLRLIQLLPVNDTISTNTWKDSYPYSSISAFALHPIYLNLEEVAGKHDAHIIKPLRKKQKQLNDLVEVDYEEVLKLKLSTARELFELQKEKFITDEDFMLFFKENKHWLVPYAAFSYLRDRNGTANFRKWKLYSDYNKAAIEKYVSPRAKHYDNIAFNYYLQYHLHKQLKGAVDYAHKLGIIIKGDIPIGVNPDSVETWMSPELFNMHMQSGAPPDDFAVKGQNWQFPTYNWAKMAEDNFEWWHKRFAHMAKYFDAFRIDHILGFFRIWNIPDDHIEGIMGYFSPALPVHVYEFAQRGMWFNYHRFCKPFITDAVLWEMFGPNKDKFLPFISAVGNHHYLLHEEFSTQKKVAEHFSALEDSIDNRRIREGLFDLISNVILFEVKDSNGQQFHFRISMENTSSFKHLDWNTQQMLKGMYNDYFYVRQEEFWRKEAMKKLPSLKLSTNMLICGEDLGMVPRVVPEVMSQLGILSLEIQRMPKDINQEFFHPANAPYLSVVTPSTHDMSTIRSWWEENRQITQDFFNKELAQWGDAPETCEAWINKAIIIQHLYSPAMWSIFQLQDMLGMDPVIRRENHESERINVPAVSNYYWRYRMHIPLEQLLKENEFNEELKKYVEASGR